MKCYHSSLLGFYTHSTLILQRYIWLFEVCNLTKSRSRKRRKVLAPRTVSEADQAPVYFKGSIKLDNDWKWERGNGYNIYLCILRVVHFFCVFKSIKKLTTNQLSNMTDIWYDIHNQSNRNISLRGTSGDYLVHSSLPSPPR